MSGAFRLLGIDPGLRRTGWGVVEAAGSRLTHVANGTIASNDKASVPVRLAEIEAALETIMKEFMPQAVAVETAFVAKDAVAALKLGQARAVPLLIAARAGLEIGEYAPNQIKKTVTGAGHADKHQIRTMVGILLPKAVIDSEHSADALATAICHAQMRGAQARIDAALVKATTSGRARA